MIMRLRYEIRTVGILNFALPFALLATFVGIILLAAYDNLHNGSSSAGVHHEVAHELLAVLEFGLTPIAGLGVAVIVSQDPARELHMTLPATYPRTVGMRVFLYLIWTALIILLVSGITWLSGFWIVVQPAPLNQLLWLAPFVAMSGFGAMITLVLGNRAVGIAVLSMVWLGTFMLHAPILANSVARYVYPFLTTETVAGGFVPDANYWLGNRLVLIALGLVMALVAAAMLHRSESILSHED
jgi:hypothetical protein